MRAGDAGVEELHVLRLDPFPRPLAEEIASGLSRRVHAGCRVSASPSPPAPPRLPERDQADADAVLEQLEARPAPARAVVVGLTSLDIAIPVFTFVFGRARQGSHAALVSLARLDPAFYGLPADPGLLTKRAVDEIVHELGHAAGLPHCRDAACLMSFAGSVEKADVRGSRFCGECRARLPAWLAAAGAAG
jgi:archaemetzincin